MRTTTKKPIIFHIDFDSYFASVARLKYPLLKGKPIAICKSKSHAIAVSISYELKNTKLVRVGMKKEEIRKLVPETVFVDVDMDLCISTSNSIFGFLGRKYTENIHISSIDECFLDVTNLVYKTKVSPKFLARQIQQEILRVFDIPITIGISHNKFLAKMTTNISKPFGIGFTNEANFKDQFFHLPIGEFHGIGWRSAPKLESMGLKTIGDLYKVSTNMLLMQTLFGKYAETIIKNLQPYYYENIQHHEKQLQGLGNEITFEDYYMDEEIKIKYFDDLIKKVSGRAIKHNLVGNVVSVLIRTKEKKWFTKQHKISKYINTYEDLHRVAFDLFDKHFRDKEYIGIGVRISGLRDVFDIYIPVPLFQEATEIKKYENLNINFANIGVTKNVNKEKSKFTLQGSLYRK
ncbi:DNA polymerase IV [Mycoplasma sp. 2045]|uniref:Y-family DNA polymerase n=1 Tax=unclassified Mycoplasma TaxID=2683645 RepID=UPI00211CA059|nr:MULTISPECIES: DNA polymerase IV [unclassified Mycoplasma]MEA4191117.1 DNA polymerase IV [Mycoplasma sp. 2248]UUM20252.1 DNA polymerase IV [Mycoplasma sp. 2045]